MFIADFHIHSKYSRATSKDMDIDHLSMWAKLKGVDLLGTGDFTHPDWLTELKNKLEKVEYGIYRHEEALFMLTSEVANLYYKNNRGRKIHNIIFAPSLEVAGEITNFLAPFGKLFADGRPMLSIESDKMVAGLSKISDDIFVVPAHVWTPHFSLFGSNSGFDSIEECFGDQASKIWAMETGLSSDPSTNWRWSALDKITLISNSDAHSPSKIAREANVFKNKFSYKELIEILKTKDKTKFLFTIEFYPQEGKYHWDGHRKCNAGFPPKETKKYNYKCPACGGRVTVGVMHRVEELGDREEGYVLEDAPSYKNLIPLIEIISSAIGVGGSSQAAQREYNILVKKFGNEIKLLLEVPETRIRKECPPKIACGIINARNGNVEISPGYDGVYGKVSVCKETEGKTEKQLELF